MTGRSPQRSSRGNEYILVGYHYDGNAILAQPTKDRSATSLTTAWERMHKHYEHTTNNLQIYVLDNERSTELTNAFKNKGVTYQLDSSYNRRTNMAERAIKTYKNHFKAGLASCDPSFLLLE